MWNSCSYVLSNVNISLHHFFIFGLSQLKTKDWKTLQFLFYHVLPTTIYPLSNTCKKTFIEVELEYLLEANNLKVIEKHYRFSQKFGIILKHLLTV